MGHTLILLTASVLAQTGQGQVVEYPSEAQPRSCGCQTPQSYSTPAPSFWDKLHGGYTEEAAGQEPQPGFFARLHDRLASIFGTWNGGSRGDVMPGYSDGAMANGEIISGPAMNGQVVGGQMVGSQVVGSQVIMNGQVVSQTHGTFTEPPLSGKVSTVTFSPSTPAGALAGGTGGIHPNFVASVGHDENFTWITGQLAQVNGQAVILYATPGTVDRFGGHLPLFGTVDMKNFQAGDLVSVSGRLMSQNGTAGTYQVQHITLFGRDGAVIQGEHK